MVPPVPFLSEVSYHITQDGAHLPRTVARGFCAPADRGPEAGEREGSGCVWSVSMRHRKPQAPVQEDTLSFHYSWSFNASPCSPSSNWKASRPFPEAPPCRFCSSGVLFSLSQLSNSGTNCLSWSQRHQPHSILPSRLFPFGPPLGLCSPLPSQLGHSFLPGESYSSTLILALV